MKKLLFSLMATVIMGLVSVHAQSKTPKGFTSLKDVELGLISSYAGPCIQGPGICSGTISPDSSTFEVAIKMSSETSVTFAFSGSFYQRNISFLQNGLNVGQNFALPQVVSERIGLSGEFVVEKNIYRLETSENIHYVTLQRVR